MNIIYEKKESNIWRESGEDKKEPVGVDDIEREQWLPTYTKTILTLTLVYLFFAFKFTAQLLNE